jgi:hypothetical protein
LLSQEKPPALPRFVVMFRNDLVSLAFCWREVTVTHMNAAINAFFVGFSLCCGVNS